MKAVIMAGGAGKRLRPLTCDCPKPMTPMMNRPVMAYGVELLKRHGVRDIAVTLQYLPHRVMDYFGNGEAMGVRLHYFVENKPLGTAGSVRQALELLDETFCVVSGDALTDIDLTAALEFHRAKKALCTLALKRVDVPVDYGIVLLGPDGRVSRFYEKPGWEEIYSDLANTGVYIMEPEALARVPKDEFADFAQNLFPALLDSGAPLYGCVSDAYWCDIGDLAQYLQAHRDILDGRCGVSLSAQMRPGGIYIEGDAAPFISPTAVITGPCFIGSGAFIGERAEVGPYSVVGSGARLERDSSVKRGILWQNAALGRGASVRGAVLCDGAALKAGASAFEEAVLGKDSVVGAGGVVKPKISIWPGKRVEARCVVSEDRVWSGGEKERLFEAGAVTGSLCAELSPAMAAKLGAAFAMRGASGEAVAVACDGKSAAVAVKAALVSGLLAYGADVYDFEEATLPMLRFGMAALSLCGGAMISENGDISVRFLEDGGAELSGATERQIRATFARLDEAPRTPLLGSIRLRRDIAPPYSARLTRLCERAVMAANPRRVLILAEPRMQKLLTELFESFGWQAVSSSGEATFSQEMRGYDAGFRVNGDNLTVCDEAGRALSIPMKNALIALCGAIRGVTAMALPQETPESLVAFLAERGVEVTLTPASRLFKTMTHDFALTWFDPAAGALTIAHCMAKTGLSVGGLCALLPKAHLSSGFVECSWREVGRILRKLAETRDPACAEGVRLRHENGWALIRPSKRAAGLNILAEGLSEEYAEALAEFYVERVAALKKDET